MNSEPTIQATADYASSNGRAYPIALDSDAVQRLLPHRGPIFFARCIRILAEDHFVSHVTWTVSDMGIGGHFPGEPIVPAVYLIEAAAQTAGAGVLSCAGESGPDQGHKIGVLAGVRRCIFKRPVWPDQEVVFDLTVKRGSGGLAFVSGCARVEGNEVASLELMLAHVRRAEIFGHSNH